MSNRQMKLKSVESDLLCDLRDPEFAAEYLNIAMEEGGIEEFLIAAGKWIKANGGVAQFAEGARVSRKAVYQMFSETGNPEFRSVCSILDVKGFKLVVQPARRVDDSATHDLSIPLSHAQ